jgi:hypothetical protein
MTITINGTGTITGITAGGLPDAIITQPELATGVAGTGPAFSAYQNSAQTLSSGSYTKLQFQAEEFDTASAFDSTTNYRFTPQVAGYYQFEGSFAVGAFPTGVQIAIYKNGSLAKQGGNVGTSAQLNVSTIISMNGSTDYVELFGWVSTGQVLSANSQVTYFQGFLARSA